MKQPLLLSSSDDAIFYILGVIVAFFIGVYITRWVFGISTIIENLKVQSANLKIMRKVVNEMAMRQGMTKEEIERIEDESVNEVQQTLS